VSRSSGRLSIGSQLPETAKLIRLIGGNEARSETQGQRQERSELWPTLHAASSLPPVAVIRDLPPSAACGAPAAFFARYGFLAAPESFAAFGAVVARRKRSCCTRRPSVCSTVTI
jgi:hypothetical protein